MTPEEESRLIAAWLQGDLSRADLPLLENHLRTDAAARARLRRHANLDVVLRERASLEAPLEAWKAAPPPSPVATRPAPRMKRPVLWAMAAAVAALLCVGSFFWGGRHAERRAALASSTAEETNQGCAMLARTVNAVWEDATAQSGDTLNAGRLHLKSGLAQIEFFSGATLLLEGDAELEIVSSGEAVCRHGKLRVRVPPPARGFKLEAPGMKLVDLGTEFGLDAGAPGRATEVQVFEGEVIAHPDGAAQVSLKQGQGLRAQDHALTTLASVKPADFVGIEELDAQSASYKKSRFESWLKWSQQARQDPRLIAFYPFQHSNHWDRFAANAALPEDGLKNGGIVGATWTQGRWPMKDALEFKRPGDRVRLRIPGEYDALTFACWVRVDGLDRKYNALLLTDGYDPGAPHWQIYEDGCLMFSVSYPDPAEPQNLKKKRNQIYYSPVVFNRSETGRWHHIAVTYDTHSGEAVQYVDGRQVSREVSPFHQPGRRLVFGDCELGNWGLPTQGHKFPIRNFNGRMDEFLIYHAALSSKEIQQIYDAGKPE